MLFQTPAPTATAAPGLFQDPLTLIMLAVLAIMIFMMFRSNKKRKAQAEEMRTQMVPGAEVMTNFGLFGELKAVDEERNEALIEIAPGTIVRVHRQTLARVVEDETTATTESAGAETLEPGDERGDEPRDRA